MSPNPAPPDSWSSKTLRWLVGALVLALCYVLYVVVVWILSPENLPATQANTLIAMGLGVGISVAVTARLLDGRATQERQYREAQLESRAVHFDHRLTVLENDIRSMITAAVTHFDLRVDAVQSTQAEHGVRLEENTGEIRAHLCPMLPPDNVRSFELGRQAGRRAT